ncbi:hypothetical protein A2U01_0035891, partial [Trifolium medium]|nr:hypothetical protein [Trifolium medium]
MERLGLKISYVLQLVDNAINEDLKGENNSDKPTDPAEHSSCAISETKSVVLVVKDEDLNEVAHCDIHILRQARGKIVQEEKSFTPYLSKNPKRIIRDFR